MADSASTAAGYELNLEEYWQIIRRRRWLILGCAFLLSIFSGLFTLMTQPPPLYASSASVKITESTDMAGLLLQNVTLSPADNMSTQLALVKSYALVERVAKRLGLIPKNLTSADIRANSAYMNVVLDLKEDVNAEREGISSIITIKTTSSSAEFARDLAQAVAEEFRAYNAEEKNKRVIDAKMFIQQQLVLIGDRLRKAEEVLRDYREKNNLSSAGEGSKVMGLVVADLEKEFRSQSGHLNDLRFALAQLKERVRRGGWDFKAVSVAGQVSEYFALLNKRLAEMALKLMLLNRNFGGCRNRFWNCAVWNVMLIPMNLCLICWRRNIRKCRSGQRRRLRKSACCIRRSFYTSVLIRRVRVRRLLQGLFLVLCWG